MEIAFRDRVSFADRSVKSEFLRSTTAQNMKRNIIITTVLLATLSVVAATAVLEYGCHRYDSDDLPGEYFDANGQKIHYVEAGRGTPVILVHGLTANLGLNWVGPGIFGELSKKYRVVALDLPGHGFSGKPHQMTWYGTRMVDDLVLLMDHLKIQKAHVVGYSLGGFIALKMAAMHPDRLLSVAPCGSGWTSNPGRDLDFMRTMAESIEKGDGYGSLLERLQPVGRPVSAPRRWLVAAIMDIKNDSSAIVPLLRTVDQLVVEEKELRNNTLPALSLVGERDPLKPLADQMCAVMSNIREVVVPEADHFSTLGRPKFIAELEKFLAEHSPAASTAETAPASLVDEAA